MLPVYNPLSPERRGSDGKGKLNDRGEASPTLLPKSPWLYDNKTKVPQS